MSSIPRSGRVPGGSMATHSSILAWEIPWPEEPEGIQSMGSQRVNSARLQGPVPLPQTGSVIMIISGKK